MVGLDQLAKTKGIAAVIDYAKYKAGLEEDGRHFGYPACCVAWAYLYEQSGLVAPLIGARAPDIPEGPWKGTGFIPCVVCRPAYAADPVGWIARNITPNRECGAPFPDGGLWAAEFADLDDRKCATCNPSNFAKSA